jgi:hypothetical protein
MGPKAFSTPEARNIRDFLASRVVNGRQQIRAAITFHESGRLVMWPYGYTYTDVPGDMTVQDHDALAKLGKLMASTNGYRPEQASDLYLTSGTTRDFEYGMYRIYAYTFELSVTDYPDDSLIASETGRNKAAVLDLLTWATCPIGILGVAVRTARCGVFDDDFEVYRGWVRNADGTDTATSGAWQRGTPQQTTTATGVKQPGSVTSGRYAIVTGGAAGSNANANDLDGGTTSVTSPAFTLKTPPHQMLQFRYSFAHDAASTSADSFVVQVLDVAANTRTAVFAIHGAATNRNGGWASASVDLSAFAGRSVRLVFSATDGGPNNLVEAAFDDVRVTQPQ